MSATTISDHLCPACHLTHRVSVAREMPDLTGGATSAEGEVTVGDRTAPIQAQYRTLLMSGRVLCLVYEDQAQALADRLNVRNEKAAYSDMVLTGLEDRARSAEASADRYRGLYDAAVRGRREFRQAFMDMRTERNRLADQLREMRALLNRWLDAEHPTATRYLTDDTRTALSAGVVREFPDHAPTCVCVYCDRDRHAGIVTPTAPAAEPPCAGCGGPHPYDTSIPSPLWNAVVRAAGLRDYLCPACILREFAKAGESFTATLHGEEFVSGGVPIEVRINSTDARSALLLEQENSRLRVALLNDDRAVREAAHTAACRAPQPAPAPDPAVRDAARQEWLERMGDVEHEPAQGGEEGERE